MDGSPLDRGAVMHALRTAAGPADRSASVTPAVEVVDLGRRYGSFEAVRGISFEVCAGEVLALLGVNGAGKTSALEVVEGLAPADGGTVRILGCDPLHERAAVRRHMGVVLQSAGLPADLTVRETLTMWGRTLTDPQPIHESLADVDLVGRADVRTGSLSGGERRRLDVALALLGRPRVVVLDEPTTGLDPESRRTVWRLIRRLVDDGVAVVLTTHHLEEAEALADRIAVMRAGVIALAGTPAEIAATQPATIRFTVPAGAPPLPRLPAVRVEHTARHVQLSTFALQPALTQLRAWAGEPDLELTGLQARAASLEPAFLAVADGALDTAA